MCDFPLGNETRFSDMFRTLIAKGYFTVPENEHPVWVLLCGDQAVSYTHLDVYKRQGEMRRVCSTPSWARA